MTDESAKPKRFTHTHAALVCWQWAADNGIEPRDLMDMVSAGVLEIINDVPRLTENITVEEAIKAVRVIRGLKGRR